MQSEGGFTRSGMNSDNNAQIGRKGTKISKHDLKMMGKTEPYRGEQASALKASPGVQQL